MYFLLFLFFASLVSIVFMIGRKLAVVGHDEISKHQELPFELPYLKKIKHITLKGVKKHGYTLVVTSMRIYMKGVSNLKDKYAKVKNRIIHKNKTGEMSEDKKEVSKFLKIIGEYKQKIRDIKHRIKKEEDL